MSIQLICVNYGKFLDAASVMDHCLKVFPFDKSTLCHPNPHALEGKPYKIHKAFAYTQNAYWVNEVPKLIECDHALSVHWDGYIIRPELWDPSWLQYDWIGAPWPLKNIQNKEWRVGSGGFFLFSKKMSDAWGKICNTTESFDWQVGQLYRDKFEALGLKFAPIDVAAKFAKECDLEDMIIPEGEQFGFHGFGYNSEFRKKYEELLYGSQALH